MNQIEQQTNRTLKTLGIRDSMPGVSLFEKQGAYDTIGTYAKTLKDINTQHDYDPANTYYKMVDKLTRDIPGISRAQASDYLSQMEDDDLGEDEVRIPGNINSDTHIKTRQESPWPDLILE